MQNLDIFVGMYEMGPPRVRKSYFTLELDPFNGRNIRRMYAKIHPAVTADAILNAGTCRENASFYQLKSYVKYDFLTHGDPIYLPIKYRNFA